MENGKWKILINTWPRRIAVTLIAFGLTAAGFFVYYNIAKADWYNTSWQYRKAITIDHTKVPGSLTDFPVLISITDSSLAANSLGNDIVFTSSDGTTKLKHEIDNYATASGQLTAWVKIPSLSSSSDTTIYMYYGNPSSGNQQDPVNVWDNNFNIVYHLSEDVTDEGTTGTYVDSTSSPQNATQNGTVEVPGKIGNAQDFDGTNDHIQSVNSPGLPTGDFTYEAWIYLDDNTDERIFMAANGSGQNELATEVSSNGQIHVILGEDSSATYDISPATTLLSNNTWYHFVFTRSGSSLKIYVNGSQDITTGTDGGVLGFSTCPLMLGVDVDTACTGGLSNYLDGRMDEVRVSNTVRSANWITTEYNNQSDPASFYSVGNQQQKKNPVLLWKFDEGSGTTANDTSGQSNFGTISGATWQNKDVCLFEGMCLKFDGTNDYVVHEPIVSPSNWCDDTSTAHGCTASWSARRKITFSGNTATTNLTNFPVLVKIDSTRIDYSRTEASGQDIRFVDPSDPTTVLPHEIESWNSSGTSYVWVKVPQIDANSQSDYIWMYYDSSVPDGQQAASVWDSDFGAVWHLKEDPTGGAPQFNDSKSTNDGTSAGSQIAGDSLTGQIGNGLRLDGTDDRVTHGYQLNKSQGTISMWIKPDVTADTDCFYYESDGTTSSTYNGFGDAGNILEICLGMRSSTWDFYYQDGVDGSTAGSGEVTGGSTTQSNWWHVTGTWNRSGNLLLYVNGSQVGSDPLSNNVGFTSKTASVKQFARVGDASRNADGTIDEFRVSSIARSADWIAAEHLSETDAMSTFGSEENSSSEDLTDPGTNSFSVAAWFRHPTTISGTDTIIARADGVNGVGYKVYFDSNAGLCFGIDGTAGSFPSDRVCGASTYNDNMWHYVEGVKSGTSSITLYVDGKQVSQDTSITSSTLSSTLTPLYAGIDADGSSNPWDGFLDEVRAYDYARSASEIKADYNTKGGILGASASLGGLDPKSALSNGLVGYWKMDDGVGNACPSGVNKACDSSGNGNVGTWTNGAASTSGKFGFAANFDGTNDQIQAGTGSSTDITGPITVSAWVYPTTVNTGKDIINRKWDSDLVGYRLFLDWQDIRFEWGDGSQTLAVAFDTNMSANQWHLMTATYDQKMVKLYWNGKLVYQEAHTEPIASNITEQLRIGGYPTATAYPMSGKIDEARVYNRALSQREVTNLYAWAPAPVGHWKLDERTGTTANDSSGNAFTGTLTNGPGWTAGKYGGGVSFDGADDYVDAVDNTLLEPSEDMTVSFWTKLDRTPSAKGEDAMFVFKRHSGDPFYSYQIYAGSPSNTVQVNWNNTSSSDDFVQGTTALTANRWYYISFVKSGTSGKIYINGVDDTTSSDTMTGSIFNSDSPLRFGAVDSTSKRVDGIMDDVRVYNYARTPKQIISDMNAGHPAVGSPIASPLVHLKLDDGFGNVASNSGSLGATGNGGLISMANPATYGSGWTTNGKFGKALAFDGSNDFVQGMLPASTITNQVTMSAWVFPTTTGSQQNFFGLGVRNSDRIHVEYNSYPQQFSCENTSGGVDLPANQTYAVNQWYHVVCTQDSTTLRIYVNGQLKNSSPSTMTLTTNRYTLGSDVNSPNFLFNGRLDEAKIYNYALNANEIKVEMNQGKGIVLGSLSTNPDGTASNSAARAYCPPGNSETNCAGTGVLNPAPIAEWKMDEHTGTRANDTSGNGLNGALTNGPVWAGGKVGASLNFDGSDDYVAIPHSTTLQPTNISVGAWINPSSNFTYNIGAIVSKANSNGWDLSLDRATGTLYFEVFVGGAWRGANFTYGSALPFNSWSYVAGTYDGTTVRLYLNGVQVATTTTSGNITYGSTNSMIIGADAGSGAVPDGSTNFSGKIDDVRIYDYARSQAQVAWDYNRAQPFARYRFDECTGNTLYNSVAPPIATWSAARTYGTRTGAGGSNTSSGTCDSGVSTEAWSNGATGKFNSSLDFDGTDDAVIISDNNFANFGANQDFTIATWVKTSQVATLNQWPAILSKENGSTVGYGIFLHDQNDDARWYGEIIVGGAFYTAYGKSDVADGQWHHLVFQRSGSQLKTYQDGKLVGTTNAVASDISSGLNLFFGNRQGLDNDYDGQLDDTMMFNYALTPAQIKVLFNQNSAVRFAPPTGRPQ